MRCYRKILHISYKDHVTNEEVRARIQQAIGPHEDLLTIVKRHKLQWYSHVSRSSGLAKTILQGTVKGGRRQGRQRKRWEDNIREWTCLEFGKSQRAVENRKKMEKTGCKIICGAPTALVVKGLMMMMMIKSSQPQRITPGPRETFIIRYIVERANKAELRPEEQSEMAESHRENLWNGIQLKGP